MEGDRAAALPPIEDGLAVLEFLVTAGGQVMESDVVILLDARLGGCAEPVVLPDGPGLTM